MGEKGKKILIGKVFFEGDILLKTGLHIGGSKESLQIGGVDLPILRDSATTGPYIPGSSLKGKLRSILEKFGKRKVNSNEEHLSFNRNIGTWKNKVFIHCCKDAQIAIGCEVCRIFGTTSEYDRGMKKGNKSENLPSTIFVRDSLLRGEPEDVLSEVKVETGVDRVSGAANPRRVERVVPGTRFAFDMVYNIDAIAFTKGEQPKFDRERIEKDLNNILTCMEILEAEALGGYGSRGYGKIKFEFNDVSTQSLRYFMEENQEEKSKLLINGVTGDTKAVKGEINNIVTFLEREAGEILQ